MEVAFSMEEESEKESSAQCMSGRCQGHLQKPLQIESAEYPTTLSGNHPHEQHSPGLPATDLKYKNLVPSYPAESKSLPYRESETTVKPSHHGGDSFATHGCSQAQEADRTG